MLFGGSQGTALAFDETLPCPRPRASRASLRRICDTRQLFPTKNNSESLFPKDLRYGISYRVVNDQGLWTKTFARRNQMKFVNSATSFLRFEGLSLPMAELDRPSLYDTLKNGSRRVSWLRQMKKDRSRPLARSFAKRRPAPTPLSCCRRGASVQLLRERPIDRRETFGSTTSTDQVCKTLKE